MSWFNDYIDGRVLRDNPEMMKEYIEKNNQGRRKQFMNQVEQAVAGQQAQPGVYNNPQGPNTKYGAMDLRTQKVMDQLATEAQGSPMDPGRVVAPAQKAIAGLTDKQLAMRLLQAPTPGNRKTGGSLLQTLLNPRNLQNGTQASTQAIRNYQFMQNLSPAQRQEWNKQRNIGQRYYNVGSEWRNPSAAQATGVNPMAINLKPQDRPAYLQEKAMTTGRATNLIGQEKQDFARADLAKESQAITKDIRDLAKDMSDMTQFGYVQNMIPAITAKAQQMENLLANLIPTVIENLGPGPKSDSDLLLLEKMLPSMGMEKPAFEKALDSFETRANAIINKSHGAKAQVKKAPVKKAPVKWEDL